MRYRNASLLVLFVSLICCLALTTPAFSSPPPVLESAQVYFPVTPCRVVDTRLALGPLPAGTARDIYVRGHSLPAQGGSSNCNVPNSATGVVVNVAVLNTLSNGHLKANRTGALATRSHQLFAE